MTWLVNYFIEEDKELREGRWFYNQGETLEEVLTDLSQACLDLPVTVIKIEKAEEKTSKR